MHVFFFDRKKVGIVLIAFSLLMGAGLMIWFQKDAVSVLEPIYQGSRSDKTVALAINVDWGEDIIPQMLDIFAEANIKATFFVTGRFAEKFPYIIKQLEKEGHEIGNHGYSHGHPDRTGFGENQRQIIETEKVLKSLINSPAKLYAPPYGECSPPVVEAADKLGYRTIMWTIDTVDWKEGNSGINIAEKVVSHVQNGAIVLMHPKEVTVDALPIIIKELKDQGYNFEKISQIIPARESQNN